MLCLQGINYNNPKENRVDWEAFILEVSSHVRKCYQLNHSNFWNKMFCQVAFFIWKNNTIVLNNISLALFLSSILNESTVLEGGCSNNNHRAIFIHTYWKITWKYLKKGRKRWITLNLLHVSAPNQYVREICKSVHVDSHSRMQN